MRASSTLNENYFLVQRDWPKRQKRQTRIILETHRTINTAFSSLFLGWMPAVTNFFHFAGFKYLIANKIKLVLLSPIFVTS